MDQRWFDADEALFGFTSFSTLSVAPCRRSATLPPAELRLADTAGVSLVMLDLMMPGLDGSATLERIRDRYPKLPVILMSGFHDFAEPPAGTPLLRKPFGLDELTRALRGVM